MQLAATIEHHSHRNGGCAPDPTEGDLPLAQADVRPAFERMAERLVHRSSVERISWDEMRSPSFDLAGEGLDQSRTRRLIGNMPPPIQICVSADWGTREGLDFLRTLASDIKDGARNYLSIPVTNPILGLIEELQGELKVWR